MFVPKFASALCIAVICASGIAAAQDMFVYPNKGQSAEQQDRDKYECHNWAVKQSGYDPTKAAAAGTQPSSTSTVPAKGGLLKGATRGAAVGAVGGAIGGDAGKGAAIGAATGGLVGTMRRSDQVNEQAATKTTTTASTTATPDAYKRAASACLQGRGYTIN